MIERIRYAGCLVRFALMAAVLPACGTAQPVPDSESESATSHGQSGRLSSGYRPGGHAPGGEESRHDDDVALQNQIGSLNQGDVDRALEAQVPMLVSCYERAGDARRYASGEVRMRFLVASTGVVSDVVITESSLGHYMVERCLVVEGRKIKLPPPGGNAGTDFEYSLRFRSSGEDHVVQWDSDSVRAHVATQTAALASCGVIGLEEIRAVMYIGPAGDVASVGLSSAAALDSNAAICAVEQMRKWRLSGDGSHIVRTTFVLPSAAAMSAAKAAPEPSSNRRDAKRQPRRRM